MNESLEQPPGWYPHPEDPNRKIWWTGDAWGQEVQITPTSVPTQQVFMPAQPKGLFQTLWSCTTSCMGVIIWVFVGLWALGWLLSR